MRKIYLILFLIAFLCTVVCDTVSGMNKTDSLLFKANLTQVGNKILIYGFSESGSNLQLYCNYISEGKADSSVKFDLGNFKATDFHEIGFDTLHGFLNFRIQKKDNEQTCTLVRLNKKLKLIVHLKEVDATRLNSFWIFNEERLFYKNDLYMVKAMTDSVGKFYLQKFHVKDTMKSFEYDQDWQFNFHKSKYQSCHLFYADSIFVWLFIDALDGEKQGQWVLKLRVSDGEVEHASLLQEAIPRKTFVLSTNFYDVKKDEMIIAGLAFDQKAVDYTLGTFETDPLKKPYKLFLISLDASGDFAYQISKDLSAKYFAGIDKTQKKLLLRLNKISATAEGVRIETEFMQENARGNYATCGLGTMEYTMGMNGQELFRDDYSTLMDKGKYIFYKQDKEPVANEYEMKKGIDGLSKLLCHKPILKGIIVQPTGDKLAWLSYRKDLSNSDVEYGAHSYVKGKAVSTVYISFNSFLRPELLEEKKGKLIIFHRILEEKGYEIIRKDW